MSAGAHLPLAALVTGFALAAAKLAAAAVTGSSALLASGVQSLVEASGQSLLRIGGPGSEEQEGSRGGALFWGPVGTMLLYSFGAGIALLDGVRALLSPEVLLRPDVAYAVLGVALGVMAVLLTTMLRPFLSGSVGAAGLVPATLRLHDRASLAGLIVTLAGVAGTHLGGWPAADGLAALLIGLLMAAVAALSAITIKREVAAGLAIGQQMTAVPAEPDAATVAPVDTPAEPTSAASPVKPHHSQQKRGKRQ